MGITLGIISRGGIFFSLKQQKELQKELQKMQANLSISKWASKGLLKRYKHHLFQNKFLKICNFFHLKKRDASIAHARIVHFNRCKNLPF